MSNGANIVISNETEFPPHSNLNLAQMPDPLLVDLVHLADTLDVEHAISLTIGGALITGTLFSGFRFFEQQAAAAMAGQVVGDTEAHARSYQQKMVDFYRARMSLYEPARLLASDSSYAPRFIHLHNAKWVGNDGMFTGESRLWRGRIVTVSGFAVAQV